MKYMIDIDEIKSFLNRTDINFAEVSRMTGLSKMTLSNLRTGRTHITKIKFFTVLKIQEYIDSLKDIK